MSISIDGARPGDRKFIDVKPVAVVFPQFHKVKENDEFYGEGFTEWTFLRPMRRVVNNITIRKPHPDIGYYNILDYEHRRYMRVIADHFGVYGFNFYHYWFKNHPVMHKPAEMMLLDGEPNKPFFLTWSNEPWSKHFDGGRSDILLAQDYDDDEGNIAHFQYLLKFFKHRNYMTLEEKPIFCFYRVDREDIPQIAGIIKTWNEMALAEGLKGIYFMRFFGFFDNTVRVPGLNGYIEFEPGLSWQPQGGGPSVFPDGVFNEKIFLDLNKDIAELGVNATEYYLQASPIEQSYRTSQFKVYDKKRTWRVIERRHFRNFPNTIRGTFVNWNNSPRRNFTNGDFLNYPHMIDPPSPSGFSRHLQTLLPKVVENVPDEKKLLQLTAWNEWNEQSVFEPNDIDGYAALQEIKNVVRAPTNRVIVHVGYNQGGVDKYIRDISRLFSHYDHLNPASDSSDIAEYPSPTSNCALLHIHSFMLGADPIKWRVIFYASKFHSAGIPIYLTIHDYQYFYPDILNPTMEFLMASTPSADDLEKTVQMFLLARKIIFPSKFIQKYYSETLIRYRENNKPELKQPLQLALQRAVVVPHNDILASHDFLHIPPVKNDVVNVAYVGDFSKSTGGNIFVDVAEKLQKFLVSDKLYQVQYHVFGSVLKDSGCSNCGLADISEKYPFITFHGQVGDNKALTYYFRKNNIQILFFSNLFPEPYNYALSIGINKGIPIVYLNRGCFVDSLDHITYEKYFPAALPEDMPTALQKALKFTVRNAGEGYYRCCRRSFEVQPGKWYINNYPVVIT